MVKTPISSQHDAAAIFYQIFKGKKYKAADSLEQFISTAVTQRAVPIPVLLLPPVMLINRCVLQRTFLILSISLKRKQALLRSNLPAIRLMATIVEAM